MASKTETVQTLASEAYGWFEVARRITGDTATGPREDGDEYTRLKEDAPEWVSKLVQEAHGDMFPDDWRYDAIRAALEGISESDDPDDYRGEWADSYVDVYTGARLAWLSSNLMRPGYCDDAVAELGEVGGGIIDLIGLGQYAEAEEVYGLVLSALESRLEEVSA